MKRQFLLLILCLCLAVGLLAVPAAAADVSGTCGENVSWTLSGSTLTISGQGAMRDYEDSKREGPPWRSYSDEITKVVVAQGVTHIGNAAFSRMDALSSVSLPASVLTIGDEAFSRTTALKQIKLPNGLTSIGTKAFLASGLMAVTLGDHVTTLGEGCFLDCESLQTVRLSPALRTLGKEAFQGCSYLGSVEIPAGVTELPDDVFRFCKSLRSVVIPEGVTSIGSFAFYNCVLLKEVSLPSTLTELGSDCFSQCRVLQRIEIPEGVTVLPEDAFFACEALTEAKLPRSLKKINSGAFHYCSALKSIDIPEGVTFIGHWAFDHCEALADVELPASLEIIDNAAFSYSGLTSVTVPEGVVEVDDYAFQQCGALTTAVIPDSVTKLGQQVFDGCRNLSSVRLGNGITQLQYGLFTDTGLTELDIPYGVKRVENHSVREMPNLRYVTVPPTVEYLGEDFLAECPNAVIRCPEFTLTHWAAMERRLPYELIPDYDFEISHAVEVQHTIGGVVEACTASSPSLRRLTVQVLPEEGWYIGAITIYYDSETELDLDASQLSATEFAFMMPDCDVLIDVVFVSEKMTFADVAVDAFYFEPVMWAVHNDITSGLSATEFGPSASCNRAQVVTFLWRAAGCPMSTVTENPFEDVKESDFYYDAVLWAVENGITTGVDATHFGPAQSCNRAQVVTFLHRAMGSPEVSTESSPFTDVEAGEWYEQAVLWAVEKGVTNGMSADTFGVNTVCNRAQVVTFLYRTYVN